MVVVVVVVFVAAGVVFVRESCWWLGIIKSKLVFLLRVISILSGI
jgi:hypothetical protein